MKKTVLASLLSLGIVAMATSSYAQGQVNFQNNNFGGTGPGDVVNAPVTFGMTATAGNGRSGTSGVLVGSDFTADLLYSLDGGSTYTVLTAANANDPSYPAAFGVPGATDGDSANFAGSFFGGVASIPGYTSGPVSFEVRAWQGASSFTAAQAARDWTGISAPFTLSSIQVSGQPGLPSDFTTMQAFVVTVPEPSVFALAGLGAAGLMAFRRKKA
jgi:hypothetical protein